MSLGTGALKVSGVLDAISHREVSMATLERGNRPNERPLSSTVTLKEFSGNNLPERILTLTTKHSSGEGGEGARIRNDSQVIAVILIRKDQLITLQV